MEKQKTLFILTVLSVLLTTSCKKEDSSESKDISVGSYHQGGLVVYVDESGQHGLIITDFDVATCEWSNGPESFSAMNSNDYYNTYGVADSEIGAGKYNTKIIVDSFGSNGVDYAAKVCLDLVHDGYDDWFLPSREEIRKAYYSDVFSDDTEPSVEGYYWTSNISSSEGSAIVHRLFPWLAQSSTGQSTYPISGQPNNPHKVRAMREF